MKTSKNNNNAFTLVEVQLKPYTGGSGGSGVDDRYLKDIWGCPIGPEDWMYTYSLNKHYWGQALPYLPDPDAFLMVRDRRLGPGPDSNTFENPGMGRDTIPYLQVET